MRLACVHCFTIEAPTAKEGKRQLADLEDRINKASARLGIGYTPGFVTGQPQPQSKEQHESV